MELGRTVGRERGRTAVEEPGESQIQKRRLILVRSQA